VPCARDTNVHAWYVEAFIDACVGAPAALRLRAEAGHWGLFRDLCARTDCRGNLVQDAYLAALALEHDCVFVTTDRDFARFPGLRWRHRLDDPNVTEYRR
jgi:predicted nucleic acid-binding protein